MPGPDATTAVLPRRLPETPVKLQIFAANRGPPRLAPPAKQEHPLHDQVFLAPIAMPSKFYY
jgi:hypothetical protein